MGALSVGHIGVLVAAIDLLWICMKGLGYAVSRWRSPILFLIAVGGGALQSSGNWPELVRYFFACVAVVFCVGGIISVARNPNVKSKQAEW